MEGTQPSAAGGDGAPTAMVAVPGLSGALTQGYTFLGGSGTVSMEASLRLRAKDYAAHDRWLVNLQDVITSNRLDDLWENQQVPTLEAVQRQFTKETSAKQQELFTVAMKQWQTENTQLSVQSRQPTPDRCNFRPPHKSGGRPLRSTGRRIAATFVRRI